MSPDNDNDNYYDFNLHCNWTIQMDAGKVVNHFFEYLILQWFMVDEEHECEDGYGDYVLVSYM